MHDRFSKCRELHLGQCRAAKPSRMVDDSGQGSGGELADSALVVAVTPGHWPAPTASTQLHSPRHGAARHCSPWIPPAAIDFASYLQPERPQWQWDATGALAPGATP